MMTEITEDIKEDEMAFAEKIKEEIRRIDDVEKSLRRLAGNEIVCNAEYNRRNVSDCLELADSLRLLLVSYDESFALTEEKTVGCSREIKRDVGLVSYIEFPIFFTAGDGESAYLKWAEASGLAKMGRRGSIKSPFPSTTHSGSWSSFILSRAKNSSKPIFLCRDIKSIWLSVLWLTLEQSAFPKGGATVFSKVLLNRGWIILIGWKRELICCSSRKNSL